MVLYLAFGGSNQIVNNPLMDGTASIPFYGPAVGSDDCIVLASETGDLVQGNTIKNAWDAAIEFTGLNAGITIANNTIDNVTTGIGGWWTLGLVDSNIVSNTMTNTSTAFQFYRNDGLMPAGALYQNSPAETGIYFSNNNFDSNKLLSQLWWNHYPAAIFLGGFTNVDPDGNACNGGQVCLLNYARHGAGTDPAPNQFFVSGNTFSNNTFPPGTINTMNFLEPAVPGAAIDRGNNVCVPPPSSTDFPLSCTVPTGPLNAVDVLASTQSGASSACNGTATTQGTGVAYSGTSALGPDPNQDWRYVLAQIYGGLDLTTRIVDCAGPKRQAIVANYSSVFQSGCTNGAAVCGDAPHLAAGDGVHAPLWHAFRLDDGSEASQVFASLIGLSPAPSNSALNGFGVSPYCNALNWDTSAANGAICALGKDKQFVGPGGVLDPAAADGVHRRPPPGTWGDNPDPSSASKLGADVLPTSFQDNDPIRRPCLGGTTNSPQRSGEEVCNIDGALGLVLPVPSSDFIPQAYPGLVQYPTNTCDGGFTLANPPNVYTCAPRGNRHFAECPNGDAQWGGMCWVPTSTASGTQCVATRSTVAAAQIRSLGSPDGRAYNVHMFDGSTSLGRYIQEQVVTGSGTVSLDFVGGYGRIHQVETVFPSSGTPLAGCQQSSAPNQIGCLAQADPCSIGFAGDAARTWSTAAGIDAARLNQRYPDSVQYPLSCGTGPSCQQ
jgi:hypothetical protein